MNWQSFWGSSGSADWVFLTAFHSLWISLAAFLILRRFRSPTVRSTWCTCTLLLLLAVPLITWLIPRTAVPVQPRPEASIGARETSAGVTPLLIRNRVCSSLLAFSLSRVRSLSIPSLLWRQDHTVIDTEAAG